jgi:hypothetical protein
MFPSLTVGGCLICVLKPRVPTQTRPLSRRCSSCGHSYGRRVVLQRSFCLACLPHRWLFAFLSPGRLPFSPLVCTSTLEFQFRPDIKDVLFHLLVGPPSIQGLPSIKTASATTTQQLRHHRQTIFVSVCCRSCPRRKYGAPRERS